MKSDKKFSIDLSSEKLYENLTKTEKHLPQGRYYKLRSEYEKLRKEYENKIAQAKDEWNNLPLFSVHGIKQGKDYKYIASYAVRATNKAQAENIAKEKGYEVAKAFKGVSYNNGVEVDPIESKKFQIWITELREMLK